MKKIILLIVLFASFVSYSQDDEPNKLSYSITLNTTFARNSNFGEYNYYTGETDRSIVTLGALLLRTGLDYRIHKKFLTGVFIGIDRHFEVDITASPVYFESKYVISQDDDDIFYLSGGYGKLVKISDSFEEGKYFKVGLGYNLSSNRKSNTILSLDFHQKNIDNYASGKLNSLSLGLGLSF